MKYYQTKLKRNRKSSRPHRLLFFDVETNEEKLLDRKRLRMNICVSLYNKLDERSEKIQSEEVVHYSIETFLDYVVSKTHEKTCLYLIAHNAQFDLWTSGLIKGLSILEWEASFFYESGMTFIFSCRFGKRKICVLSTTNWYPFTLAKCARMIGMKKGEIDFANTSLPQLVKYCKLDVQICRKLFYEYLDFITKNDLGKFSYTRPSQAMCAFRHSHLQHDIYIHHEKDIQELERKCYYGGRCEIWEQKELLNGPFVSLDINSMYPFIMKYHNFPRKLLYKREKLDLQFIPKILKYFCICAHCLIKTNKPLYALRPKNKTIFPVGEFEVYLCSEGIKEAYERGHLLKVYKAAIYEYDKLFTNYVDFFYNLRLDYQSDKNDIMEINCKIFLNSFYGKWGQMIPDTVEWYEKTNDVKREFVTVEGYPRPLLMSTIMHKTTMETSKSVGARTFTAIAAHVTEKARFYLSSIIEKIGFDKILYCDTDCVKIRYKDIKSIRNLINPTQLGMLKFEGCTNNFTIHAPKDYVWNGKEKIKGVPEKAERITEGKYLGERFLKAKTLMKEGASDYIDIVPLPKELKRIYTKAKKGENNRFIPFSLPQDNPMIY